MRPRYSFSSRMSKRARESPKLRKQKEKYTSMAERIVNQSDIILEVLDSRFVEKTRNFELEDEIKKQKKKLIFVLNKSDIVEKINKLEINSLKLNVKI